MKKLIIISVLALVAATVSQAATTINVVGANGLVCTTQGGTTNSTSLATNGLYTSLIATATTETNLVQITPNNPYLQGKAISVQFFAACTAANTNSAVFTISSATVPINPSATWGTSTNAMAGSTTPRSVYGTVTLPLNGTANTLATTNVVFTMNSTPPYGGGTELFIESIGNSGTSTGSLTNVSVYVGQSQ